MIVYDIETENAILGRNETRDADIKYADGFHDFQNMGIACVGVLDYASESPRVFLKDNLPAFGELVRSANVVVGFNNHKFGDKLLAFNEITIPDGKSYDILEEVWRGLGLAPEFNYRTHGGLSLGALAQANFGRRKQENGALAPIMWQRGERGRVIDYCLADVALTRMLLDRIIRRGELVDPRTGRAFSVRPPSPEVKR